MTIEAIIARFGVAAIFAGAAVEGEAAVVAGGLIAHQGLVSLPLAMIAAALGSFAADQGWFMVGRRFRDNRRIVAIRARPAFARAVAAVERRPTAFIFIFRFLYGLRTISPIAIGTTAVPHWRYTTINAVSAALWGVIFTGIGYLFGDAFERFVGKLKHDARLWWIVGALVVGGAAIGLVHRLRSRRA